MKEELDVIFISDNEDFNTLSKLYEKPEINQTFNGYRMDRIICSAFSFLIYLNNEPIGFILLVKEERHKNDLAIDIAILKKYRNNGYGKKAMEIFKAKYLHQIDNSLIAEVNKNNTAANKLIKVLDIEYLKTVNDSNFYTIKNSPKI